ncbi:MAG: 4Fe-4S cluster-binding domain-containing protein, partial [Clostridia bacterium]
MKKGIINSFQSLGTLDGPGVRFVVFMQGCPYRCIYCHNPETWDFKNSNAIVMTPQELIDKIIPYKPYFGKVGGVTVSGGEPLCQAEFLIDFFTLCHENGITTALDTTGGVLNPLNEKLISLCDYILLDIKFSTTEDYKKYTSHQKNQNTSCEKADFFISKSSTLSK